MGLCKPWKNRVLYFVDTNHAKMMPSQQDDVRCQTFIKLEDARLKLYVGDSNSASNRYPPLQVPRSFRLEVGLFLLPEQRYASHEQHTGTLMMYVFSMEKSLYSSKGSSFMMQ